MKKIAFIGAGSFVFTRNLVRDILTFSSLADAHIALMDIDEERLSYIRMAVEDIAKRGGYANAKVTATLSRPEALEGADAVIISVLTHDHHVFARDIDIPMKYGVDINIGDTRGPAAIFRFLRSAPILMEIARDIEKYAPNALVLNYSNPMDLICRYLQTQTNLKVIGLCHSVQQTSKMLADWIGADYADVSYLCAGINHQAFFLDYRLKGEDAYPLLREAVKKPEIYNKEQVRNEMFRNLGYYVTESSGHSSEYTPWFRKRPDLIEKYCTHGTNWNPGLHAYTIQVRDQRETKWRQDILDALAAPDADLTRHEEYASYILDAYFGGENPSFTFNGNILNHGYLTDLPDGCCVEVPIKVFRGGWEAQRVGALPPQLALLIGTNARCESLAVDGLVEKNREKIYHSILFDPLTSAVCSMQEIRDMVDEMFAANREYLAW